MPLKDGLRRQLHKPAHPRNPAWEGRVRSGNSPIGMRAAACFQKEVAMRAMAVFPQQHELRIIDVPAPKPMSERDVTVRIREVGICGTDREISGFHYGTPPLGKERLV